MRLFIILFLTFSACYHPKAQPSITDGTISYDISIDSDEAAAAFLALGASLEVSFKGQKTRIDASVAGGSNTVRILADYANMTGLSIMNVLNEKKAVKMTAKNFDDAQNNLKTFRKNPTKHLDSYKTIAGYECQKVLMKDLQSGASIIFYVSPKINPKSDKIATQVYQQLKGFPLGVSIRKDGNTVQVKARQVSSNTPKDSAFHMTVPSGYQLTSIKELEALFNGRI